MAFHPGKAAEDAVAGVGAVDYRLQRRRALADFNAGMVAQSEVCDAHPELLRVARNCAKPSSKACPVCDDVGFLSTVYYVFGTRLSSAGKLALTEEELDRYLPMPGEFAAYQIEVCSECGWNHLLRRIPLRP